MSLLLIPCFAWSDNSLPAGSDHEAYLGMGYDSEKESLQGVCLKGSMIVRGKQESNVSFTQSLDESSMQKELGIDAGTRFRYGEATVKASAKFMKASRNNGFSISAVYSGDYKFKNQILVFEDSDSEMPIDELEESRLTDVGKVARRDDDRWRETCGDEYVAQIVRGAKLFYSIRIEFLTQEEKDLFEAAFSYDSALASVHAHLKNVSSNFSKRTKIVVGALQIGGDARKITELFYDQTDVGNESSLGFVQCSFGDLEKCDDVLANAIRYATHDFKEQLESRPDSPAYEGGPADLRYITKPYSDAGIYPQFASILTSNVRRLRRDLEDHFNVITTQLGAVNSLIKSDTVVLSSRQLDNLKDEKKKLDKNVTNLVDAATICYDSVTQCEDVANMVIDDLEEFDENSIIITPETFRQYCALADSSLSTRKLRESISGMIEAARELEPNSFSTDPEGNTDLCLQAHGVFIRNSEIVQFRNKGISTLVPLEEYQHFTEVDFSENEIDDLSPVEGWRNIEYLGLAENRIQDISALSRLLSLRRIDISGNRLRSIESLTSLPDLERVDARNNFDTVDCTNLSTDIVCLSATVRTDARFIHSSTNSIRPAFLPSVVNYGDGEFFVLSDSRDLQTYELSINRFVLSGQLERNSRGRVATALSDGDVLITGGWDTGRGVAIYNPDSGQALNQDYGLQVNRVGHTATLLNDGRVLIVGGWEGGVTFDGINATFTTEIFDPATNMTAPAGNLHAPRAWHTATLLDDGRVLIAGGFSWDGGVSTAEIFDPQTDEITQLGYSMSNGRGAHTATLLNNGKVLIAGGFDFDAKAIKQAELFNPFRNRFEPLQESMNWARAMHSAVLLNNGKVLLAGGSEVPFVADHPVNFTPSEHINRGELFDPVENSFMRIPGVMAVPRARHQMVETRPGTVLVIGGTTWESANQLEVFNYVDVNVTQSN